MPAIEPLDVEEALPAPLDVTWEDIPPVDVLALKIGYRLIPLVDHQSGQLLRCAASPKRVAVCDRHGTGGASHRVRDNLDLKPTSASP